MRFLFGLITLIFAATASLAQDYSLKPGDVINIEVVEDSSLNRSVLILPDGNFSFPFAGTVKASGRSISQIESTLRTRLAPNFATEPTVFVSINSLAQQAPAAAAAAVAPSANTITVYIIGEVNSPGTREFEPGTNFLQALAETGGFTPFAAKKRLQLRRPNSSTGQEDVYTFNLKAIGQGATIGGNTTLRDGDVIFVPERRLFE